MTIREYFHLIADAMWMFTPGPTRDLEKYLEDVKQGKFALSDFRWDKGTGVI